MLFLLSSSFETRSYLGAVSLKRNLCLILVVRGTSFCYCIPGASMSAHQQLKLTCSEQGSMNAMPMFSSVCGGVCVYTCVCLSPSQFTANPLQVLSSSPTISGLILDLHHYSVTTSELAFSLPHLCSCFLLQVDS